MPIENMQLIWVTLAFVAIMPALYAAFIWWGGREAGFKRWQVFALPVVYAGFVAMVFIWVQPFGQVRKAARAADSSSRMDRPEVLLHRRRRHNRPEAADRMPVRFGKPGK